jgi:hypothetical protein
MARNFQTQLMQLLNDIFEDNVVTADERSSLLELH